MRQESPTRKVLAYIVRARGGRRELLVLSHRDHPEAGLQVPAGTVEPGESVRAALAREVREESGLDGLRVVRRLAVFAEPAWGQVRHVFALAAPDGLPEAWTHVVGGDGEDAGLAFDYRWEDLAGEIRLAGGQGRWLAEVRDGDGHDVHAADGDAP